MNTVKITLVVLLVSFVSGCGMIIPRISEEEAFRYEKQYLAEFEALMQTQQDTMLEKWIQPANKKEDCKIYVGTTSINDRTLIPGFLTYWDGQCMNGYAYGLGREFEKGVGIDVEAIALYSGEREKPKYYYHKDKLMNVKVEGLDDGHDTYGTITTIKDDLLSFNIFISYGKIGGKYPQFASIASPLKGNIAYVKNYNNFSYIIADYRNDSNDERSFVFDLRDSSQRANGYGFQINKNGQRFSGEMVNNVLKRNVDIPQVFYEHVDQIYNEIMQESQKALDAQTVAMQVKQQYKQKICPDKVAESFIDNAEYKAICEEDKYMADIKIKLDKELEKIAARKAQDRMIRAREVEAMAAQQQAAAVQQQANAASIANFNQSMHNMNMNNQMQQLNNNLFMLNRSPQQINVNHTVRTSTSPMWTPVR